MNIIDIRDGKESEIDGIKFDDSGDYLSLEDDTVQFNNCIGFTGLCWLSDIDDLIKALQKAKELWG